MRSRRVGHSRSQDVVLRCSISAWGYPCPTLFLSCKHDNFNNNTSRRQSRGSEGHSSRAHISPTSHAARTVHAPRPRLHECCRAYSSGLPVLRYLAPHPSQQLARKASVRFRGSNSSDPPSWNRPTWACFGISTLLLPTDRNSTAGCRTVLCAFGLRAFSPHVVFTVDRHIVAFWFGTGYVRVDQRPRWRGTGGP